MRLLIISLITLVPFISYGQDKIFFEDLASLVGDWEGSLTYMDYSSGKPYTMPANLKVEEGKNRYELVLNNIYPNEPKANSKGKLKMSKDGSKIDGKPVVSRSMDDNYVVQLIVEYEGKDGNDNKKAIIRLTYTLGDKEFINRKEVRFLDSDEWILRNEFKYQRK